MFIVSVQEQIDDVTKIHRIPIASTLGNYSSRSGVRFIDLDIVRVLIRLSKYLEQKVGNYQKIIQGYCKRKIEEFFAALSFRKSKKMLTL